MKDKLLSILSMYEDLLDIYSIKTPPIFKDRKDYALLLTAQSYQESGWDHAAVSKTGCKGFSQFEQKTFYFVLEKLLKVKDIKEWNIWSMSDNMVAQSVYMNYLIEKVLSYRNEKNLNLSSKEILELSLMSYNGGLYIILKALEFGKVDQITLEKARIKNYPSKEKIKEILDYSKSILSLKERFLKMVK